jgi:hypothetical protein
VYRVVNARTMAFRLPSPIRVDAAGRQASAVTAIPESLLIPPATVAPLQRVYVLSRDASLNPATPTFSAVPVSRRFETLLTHAHPFEMGSETRRRAFIEHLMAVSAQTDVWHCRFAPSLDALPQLASQVRAHAHG